MNSKKSRIILGIVVFTGLAIRIAAMLLFRSYEFPVERDHWKFGYEMGRVARSLALGRGFSSPLPDPTGPTALLPPAYPVLLAGIFRVFGIYTTQSAVAACVLNCVFAALACVALYWLGERSFGRKTGLLAAAWLALYPQSIWHAVNTIWDTSLLVLALVTLMALLYGLPARPGIPQLAGTGLFMGLVALVNPAPVLFYPAAALIMWKRFRDHGSGGYREIAVLTGTCLLVFVPWMLRNAVEVGSFTPRIGAGLNFRLGNDDNVWRAGSGGDDVNMYAAESEPEARLYRQMGESAYDRYCARLGMEYVRNHPDRFVALTLARIRAWWLGQNSDWQGNLNTPFNLVALKRLAWLFPLPFFVVGCITAWHNRMRAGLLWALLAIYPIPYCLIWVSERYHYPVEPFLLLVASYGMIQIWEWRGWRHPVASWNNSALADKLRGPRTPARSGIFGGAA